MVDVLQQRQIAGERIAISGAEARVEADLRKATVGRLALDARLAERARIFGRKARNRSGSCDGRPCCRTAACSD